MKIEYLVLLSNEDTFCNQIDDIIKLFNIDPIIDIKKNILTYSGKDQNEYRIIINIEISNNLSESHRFFIVKLINEFSIDIDIFETISEKLKWLLNKIQQNNNSITTLWDDIGRYYAEKSYPYINNIENLMRKLISKFMLVNVGIEWTKISLHPELVKKIESFNEDDSYINDLHKLDFIHLSEILFKKKRDLSLEELDRILLKNEFKAEDIDKIKKITPKSNWEKYFASLLGDENNKLEKKWKILYKKRNNIAHNRFIKKKDYEAIRGLVKDVEKNLNNAINKLDKISLNEIEKNEIKSSFMTNSNDFLDIRTKSSLIKYFDRMGFELRTPSEENINWDIDYILKANNSYSILEVKVIKNDISFGPLYMYFWRLVKRLKAVMKSEKLNITYLIFITKDDKIISFIKQMIKEFSSLELENIEIIVGSVNIEQEFYPLIHYSFISDRLSLNNNNI